MNPQLHLAMHEIVANQVLANEPPEMWDTAKRLTGAGYERHEVLHMLASVVSADVLSALHDNESNDPARTRAALAALPGHGNASGTRYPPSDTRTAQNGVLQSANTVGAPRCLSGSMWSGGQSISFVWGGGVRCRSANSWGYQGSACRRMVRQAAGVTA